MRLCLGKVCDPGVNGLRSQTLTAFGAAAANNRATAGSGHARQETVSARAAYFTGLIGSFHGNIPFTTASDPRLKKSDVGGVTRILKNVNLNCNFTTAIPSRQDRRWKMPGGQAAAMPLAENA